MVYIVGSLDGFAFSGRGRYLPQEEQFQGRTVYQHENRAHKLYSDGEWWCGTEQMDLENRMPVLCAGNTAESPIGVSTWYVPKDGEWVEVVGLKSCKDMVYIQGDLPSGFAWSGHGLYTSTSEQFEGSDVYVHENGRHKMYKTNGWWCITEREVGESANVCAGAKVESPLEVPDWYVAKGDDWIEAPGLRSQAEDSRNALPSAVYITGSLPEGLAFAGLGLYTLTSELFCGTSVYWHEGRGHKLVCENGWWCVKDAKDTPRLCAGLNQESPLDMSWYVPGPGGEWVEAPGLASQAEQALPDTDSSASPDKDLVDDDGRLSQIFQSFDLDRNGYLDLKELGLVLQRLNADRFTDSNVKALFQAIDKNGDGCIQSEEFVAWLHGISTEDKRKIMRANMSRLADEDYDDQEAVFGTALSGLLDDETNPRITLREAVDALPEDIRKAMKAPFWYAKQFIRGAEGKANLEKYSGLEADGAASIYLYTMETPLYKVLNRHLRSKERGSSKFKSQFYPFVRILVEALRAMAGAKMMMLNRGVPLDVVKKFPDEMQVGNPLVWWSFSSCTQKIEVLENPMFLGTEGNRTIFQIHTCKGVNIAGFSAIQSEAEYLLPPATVLKIDSILRAGGGLTIIQCSDDEDAPDLLD